MENDKQKQYESLLNLKSRIFNFYPPLYIITFWSLYHFLGIKSPLILFFITILTQIPINFWFRKKNICPWCGNSFFLFRKDGTQDISFKIFTQTQCINCGRPHGNDLTPNNHKENSLAHSTSKEKYNHQELVFKPAANDTNKPIAIKTTSTINDEQILLTQKIDEYESLMSFKTFILFGYPIFGLMIAFVLFKFVYHNPMIFIDVVVILLCIGVFWFYKRNRCPWCDDKFFIFKKDGTKSINFYHQTKCINCGKPNDN